MGTWFATLVKNDLPLATFLILQWWALLIAFKKYLHGEADLTRYLFLSGCFAGIALGYKFNASPPVLITVIGSSVFFFINCHKPFAGRFSDSIKAESFFGLGLLVSWGPWLLRSLIVTGNPVYPFLNRLFCVHPLYPWHASPMNAQNAYNPAVLGWKGLAEYISNLFQIRWMGTYGNVPIWWGPSGWFCLISFFCLNSKFQKEVRWISAIAIASWFSSLYFVLKPPYYGSPLIFVLTCCFAMALNVLGQDDPSKKWQFVIVFLIAIDFFRSFLMLVKKNLIFLPLTILISGSPPYHYISNYEGDAAEQGTIDEINWLNYLVNKYAGKDDKVLFMGSFRPAGMKRRHVAAFTLAKQPILFFAEQSSDAADLKNKLLSQGIRHIIYSDTGWKNWINNSTIDGPHNVKINASDVQKINEFAAKFLLPRFRMPSGRMTWFSVKSNETFPPIPIDAEDTYQFPANYFDYANEMQKKGDEKSAFQILKTVSEQTLPNQISVPTDNALGALYFKMGRYREAANYFTRCINANPRFNAAYVNRAVTRQTLGQNELAIKDWDKVLEFEPANDQYLAQRNKLMRQTRRN